MGSGFSALKLVKPFLPFIPEVQRPVNVVPFRVKAMYTGISLVIFLACSQLPLYGIHSTTGADPMHWMRAILASSRGTVMELGTGPLVTSGMVMQFLAGSKLIKVNKDVREDRALLKAAEKFLSILIAIGQAAANLFTGMYGPLGLLGVGNSILIIAQLCFASILMMCLDELLQIGYGLGSGVSLFTATHMCENVIWKSFSPTTINTVYGPEFEGAIPALFHGLLKRRNKTLALRKALFRTNLPNVTNLLSTASISLLAIYLQGFSVPLTVTSNNLNSRFRQRGTYPIKLFYTSNMPIILLSFGGNVLVNLLGSWSESQYPASHSIPVGGLAYYITAPSSLADMAASPMRALFYLVFMLFACAWFSRKWTEVSGSSAKDNQKMVMPGYREGQLEAVLNRHIPVAAAFGGMCLGALTVCADMMGAIGSGTGVLLAVSVIYQYFEMFDKERVSVFGSLGL
ncbi:hypothetical protein POTOM_041060 [Populus tomentosa]|uniref:Translocon Sec61/SecY plug domain-containing protein n=1 Tax=Populus tomentosa TaxID=118781 RepID=A0A8X8CIJ5_POPTO|nr:hypothetical protein POTOM_041060 [Populus tomentosa]